MRPPVRRSWSLRLGSPFGIEVFVHASFLLIVAWVAFTAWSATGSGAAVVDGVLLVLAVFGCVVLHELGHALAARRYGIGTRDITLLPIGGVARLERMPDDPRAELVVALAGPAVNVAIAAVLLGWLVVGSTLLPAERLGVLAGPFLQRLFAVNVVLVLFNLIPAFPMDGGRVLRALLSRRWGRLRATRAAAAVGRLLALGFGVVGLLYNPFLVLIALFVWVGAGQEARFVASRETLRGIPVTQAMVAPFAVLTPRTTLDEAGAIAAAAPVQTEFPVVEEGALHGLLRRREIAAARGGGGGDARVASLMHGDAPRVEASATLDEALLQLLSSGYESLPVVHAGRPVGLLTVATLRRILEVRRALDARAAPVSGVARTPP